MKCNIFSRKVEYKYSPVTRQQIPQLHDCTKYQNLDNLKTLKYYYLPLSLSIRKADTINIDTAAS